MAEKLTVLIPCRNERNNIRQCIASVRDVADEILVADSFSSDDTLDIVERIGGCRVIQREFVNFADFKNWAIPQASHRWVLIVDADERATGELAAEIKQVLRDPPDDVDGYFVPRQWFFMGHPIRYSGWQTDKLFRLIRRDRCRYGPCRVHEEIDYDRDRAGCLQNKLLHYSYWTYDEFFAKHLQYTKWAAEDLWERGRRANVANLLFRPLLRFFQLYLLRLGFLDGPAGIQVCLLMAFNSFVKQARLWQMEYAPTQSDGETRIKEMKTDEDRHLLATHSPCPAQLDW